MTCRLQESMYVEEEREVDVVSHWHCARCVFSFRRRGKSVCRANRKPTPGKTACPYFVSTYMPVCYICKWYLQWAHRCLLHDVYRGWGNVACPAYERNW